MKILPLLAALTVTAAATGPANAQPRAPEPELDCGQALQRSTEPLLFELELELERAHIMAVDAWTALNAAASRLRAELVSDRAAACFRTYPQERIRLSRWANRYLAPALDRADARLAQLCSEHGRDVIDGATQQLDRALRHHELGQAAAVADAMELELGTPIVASCAPLAQEVETLVAERLPEIRNRAARPAIAAAMARRHQQIAWAVADAEAALASSGRDMALVGRDPQGWRDLQVQARECLRLGDELRELGASSDEPVDGALTLASATATCRDFLAQAPELAERSQTHDRECQAYRRERFRRYQIHGWGMHVVFEAQDVPTSIVEEGQRVEWIYDRDGRCRRFLFDRRGRSLGETTCEQAGDSESTTTGPVSALRP